MDALPRDAAAGIDLALRAGANHPPGPRAWADALERLQHGYGAERYRPSRLLRRRHCAGGRGHA